MGPSARQGELLELDEIGARLDRVFELATPDATEIAWVETAGGRATNGREGARRLPPRRTVLIRVREGTRRGTYCTGSPEPSEILAAVRQAVAASRATEPLPLAGPWDEAPPAARRPGEGRREGGGRRARNGRERGRAPQNGGAPELWDDALDRLDPAAASDLLANLADRYDPLDLRLALDWHRLRVVVRSVDGVDRRAQATAATLSVLAGPPGEPAAEHSRGSAAASSRSLDGLGTERVVERALSRLADAAASTGDAPRTDAPLVFSQEAATALVSILVRRAFASSTFESARSPLAGLLGEHVFAPIIDLRDDALAPAGLPFPFDLLGLDGARIDLIEAGVPRTPAVDDLLAARLKRSVTPHAIGPGDARPTHPFLLPHHHADEVLAAGEGGIWIGGFDDLECFDSGRVAVRGRCREVRRIRGAELAEPLAPVIWEDSLLRLFSKVTALGGEPVVLMDDGGLGGVSAPMVCVEGAEALRACGPRPA